MKTLKLSITAAVVALMVAVGMPTQASAQQQQVEQITVGNLIAALNNINANIQDVRALNNLTIENVRIVNVENVLNNNNVRAFNNALNRNEVEINVLRDFLNNNEILNNALNNNNVAIGQVVAIDVLSGGDVIIFRQQQ
jgi:hypothetical protein